MRKVAVALRVCNHLFEGNLLVLFPPLGLAAPDVFRDLRVSSLLLEFIVLLLALELVLARVVTANRLNRRLWVLFSPIVQNY